VLTARYALSPYIKQIRLVFKRVKEIRCVGGGQSDGCCEHGNEPSGPVM
jgi:hypothetical protein